MSTSTKKKATTAKKATPTKKTTTVNATLLQQGIPKRYHPDEITLSPFNHRRYFSESALRELAEEMAVHGMISPVTVRPSANGKPELVVGERRIRAARIAQLPDVPVIEMELTDEQVIEIQLAENLQREDPHPMLQAFGIGQLQQTGKSIEEIAVRIGKSKAFVYTRIKLLALTTDVQELFQADKLTMAEALEIASLSEDSQTAFFAQHCENWKEEEDFELHNITRMLQRYTCNLSKAPFDTSDETLAPEAGACTGCAFNSATLKSLFPELETEATCNHRACYQRKCTALFTRQLINALLEDNLTALVFDHEPTTAVTAILAAIPGSDQLPKVFTDNISVIEPPMAPNRNDYFDYYNSEADSEEEKEASYNEALTEYTEELEEYQQETQQENVCKGVYIDDTEVRIVYYRPERTYANSHYKPINNQTAKAVQEALKAGTATPELLTNEINRIQTKEIRSKQLDREKIQLTLHARFCEQAATPDNTCAFSEADKCCSRLLIFQSLDYSSRHEVEEALGLDDNDHRSLYEKLGTLTDQQMAYMIRKAMAGKAESKYPHHTTASFLYELAGSAGVDVAAIEHEQQAKVNRRLDKQQERIAELERKIKRMEATDSTVLAPIN